jgi:RNA polymerase sigma-70 factor (ECF subfamily)
MPGSISCVTDEELVLLARQGDADAFDRLVTRHQSAVYRAALAALRVPEDAEEAAQDAFVRAWLSLPRFRGDASFRTWVLAIVWNRALSRRRTVVRWFQRTAPLEAAAAVAADSPSPSEHLRGTELKAQAAKAIEALTPKLRDALLLAQSGEYGYDEIAGMLKIPVGTVKWRVSEARRKVRERLAERGYVNAR